MQSLFFAPFQSGRTDHWVNGRLFLTVSDCNIIDAFLFLFSSSGFHWHLHFHESLMTSVLLSNPATHLRTHFMQTSFHSPSLNSFFFSCWLLFHISIESVNYFGVSGEKNDKGERQKKRSAKGVNFQFSDEAD